MGSVSATGTVIAALPNAHSEAHVSAAAIAAKPQRASQPYWKPAATNSVLRYEPTWGDVDVLTRLLLRLQPSNHQQMLAAFSNSSASAKALQFIRNGAAHNHSQTMADVLGLRSSYLVFSIGHPTHALFWIEPSSGDFLVTRAIEELRAAGQLAIQ
jgi:hypothetical protein